MVERVWEVTRLCYCEHIGEKVALEAEVLYPIDYLPDPPRVIAHRCSRGRHCNFFATAACAWAGTNPGVDPFRW
jgi:hypothetical protein